VTQQHLNVVSWKHSSSPRGLIMYAYIVAINGACSLAGLVYSISAAGAVLLIYLLTSNKCAWLEFGLHIFTKKGRPDFLL